MTSGAKLWPSWQLRHSWLAGSFSSRMFGPEALSQLPPGWGVVDTGVLPSQLWVWLKCIVWQSEQRFVVPACHSPAIAGRVIRNAPAMSRASFLIGVLLVER